MKVLLKEYWFIIVVLSIVIVIKSYYLNMAFQQGAFTNEKAYNSGDATHYLKIGKNIADFHVYSDSNSNIPSESATWRPPFWPFTLSILFNLTSHVGKLIVLKFLLELSLLLFTMFKITKHLSLKAPYIFHFLIIFIEPQYLKYSITFLSESFTAILILILVVYFIKLRQNKRHHFLIPTLSALVILTHPVSIFFILTIFVIYLLFNLKTNLKITILHGLIFSLIVLVWPIRNYLTFNHNIYLTASQGATFSKGWNEKVAIEFDNVDGDLANEDMNLKYVDSILINNLNGSTLKLSEAHTIGTKNFINQINLGEKLKIILTKVKSNFNPFPEKPKPGTLESIAIFFRFLYLIVLIQIVFRIFQKRKISFDSNSDKAYLVILSIFIGQILMSSYIYTGLRFNSIYSLAILFCFLIINSKIINTILNPLYKRLEI